MKSLFLICKCARCHSPVTQQHHKPHQCFACSSFHRSLGNFPWHYHFYLIFCKSGWLCMVPNRYHMNLPNNSPTFQQRPVILSSFEFRDQGKPQRFAPAPSRAREKDRAREVLVKLDSITVPVITARSACLEPRV